MLKVDIIYGNYLSNKIGPSTNLLRLLDNRENFRKEGIDFTVFSLEAEFNKTDGQNMHSHTNFGTFLRMKVNRLFSLINIGHTSIGARILIYLKYIRHSNLVIARYLDRGRVADIVVFDEFFTCLNYFKHKKGNQKVVLFHHGNGDYFKMFRIYFPGLENSNYLRKLDSQFEELVKEIDAFVFVSEFGLQNFISQRKNLTQFSSKYYKLYYGVESIEKEESLKYTDLEYAKNHLTLVCVGSVNERKGQFLIVDAFKRLEKRIRENITIHFLGSGTSELARLREDVEKSNLKDYLIFHGKVDNPNLFLANADAFILTSFDEGLPISIIEAMNYGLPIFSTRVAGIPETLDGNGILIDPNEEDVFKLLDSLHNLDLNSMSNRSRLMFQEKFSYSIFIKEYCHFLKKLNETRPIC